MTVNQVPSTGSSDRFAFGGIIFREDVQELVEMQNWVAGNRPIQHLGMYVGPPASQTSYYPEPSALTSLVAPRTEPENDWIYSELSNGTLWVSESQGFADSIENRTYIWTDIVVPQNALTGVVGATAFVNELTGSGLMSARADFIFSGSVGLVTSSLYFTTATNGHPGTEGHEQTALVPWGRVGYGWVELKVDFTISGSTPSAYLKHVRVEDRPVTGSADMNMLMPLSTSFSGSFI